MKEQVAKTWVEALRSGDYTQAVGMLYDGKGYCCLGVLCHVMGYTFEAVTNPLCSYGWRVADVVENEHSQVLPREVMDKAEIKSRVGQINFVTEDDDSEQMILAYMNDAGDSFATIADFIEENWQAL